MSVVVSACLVVAVAVVWIAVLGFLRLRTPLERLHAVTFVNVAGGGALLLAVVATDGLTPRAVKGVALWLTTLLIGALLSHVTGRALHVRDGERR